MAKTVINISKTAGSGGGRLGQFQRRPEVALVQAYTGTTPFRTTGWAHPSNPYWVVDYIHRGIQPQRIGNSRTFQRLSGIAAMYVPEKPYHEWCEEGKSIEESYIVFTLEGEIERSFRVQTGHAGYCHFKDPDGIIGDALHRMGQLLFARSPGFHLYAHGILLELLARLLTSLPEGRQKRVVFREPHEHAPKRLRDQVEILVRNRLTDDFPVAALASQIGMSVSAFAHAYPKETGESPHQTVLRVKMDAAKKLLLSENLRVKETAQRLGFSSEYQFSRAFKRMEGVSPRHYHDTLTHRRIANYRPQSLHTPSRTTASVSGAKTPISRIRPRVS